MDDALISVRLPEDVIEFIDYLVRNKVVGCRSEVLRTAVLFKLRSLGYDVDSGELEKVMIKLRILKRT